ncbi:type IV secretion system DNA-binding domain-containing protein [Patescibacteria group bacterium]|nr:type IV secretion system DNA-binding domain-containing protein [Patescibacteria group bacterium]
MNPELLEISNPLSVLEQQGQSLLANPWFWLGIFILVLIFLILIFIRYYLRKIFRIKYAFEKVVLLVTLPRERPQDEAHKKSIKEMLMPMENFFANIGGLKAEQNLRSYFLSRSDNFSFEIVSDQQGIISFYVVVPKKVVQFFEQQIQAQYPNANIEQVEDYNIFLSEGVILSAYLKLKNYSIFPIKTYLKGETDPLEAITNSLSKIDAGDAVAVQIVARSAHKGWRNSGPKVASAMEQGKSLKQAVNSVMTSPALSLLGGFFDLFSSSKEKKQNGPVKAYQLSPAEQETVKLLGEKANKAGLDVNIRIVVSAQTKEKAELYLNNVTNAFAQYTNYEYGNGFKISKSSSDKTIHDFIYRILDQKKSFILNTEEVTSVFHFPLPITETPNIRWLMAKKAAAPIGIPTEGIRLGRNVYRGEEKNIYIKEADRRRHIYIIGKTGVGKSVLIANLAIQDIMSGRGICVIDPHGDLVETILEHVPKERAEDVIYFDPSDIERPMGLNLLEYDPKYPEQKTFLINEMINILDKLYDLKTTGGPMFEQYMRNALLLIMDHPESGSTLMEISKVLADPDFRAYKLKHCSNQVVHDFWTKEAEKAGGEAALSNITPYITSKLNQFVANDIMRPIIGQQKSAFNLRAVMDDQKILLINLAKGKIGDLNAYLIGLILVGKILIAALSRTDIPEEERKDFFLYIDEFQNFITDSIHTILAEARKYRLCLTIAHQYIGQLVKNQDTSMRDAIFGTVGTNIAFKIGVEDAEFLAKEFAPVFSPYDLVNMERYSAYIKLLVDNQTLSPFNLAPDPPKQGNPERAKAIKELSRLKYGRAKSEIEREILERSKQILGDKPSEPKIE